MSNKADNFKKDLKDLLDKYKANIHFDCDDGSDLYGICGECMNVDIDGDIHILSDGWSVSKSDL
jgi:hypothetical protein